MQKNLSTGEITITPKNHQGKIVLGFGLEALFDIAERINPKRQFLFVSKLLQRHTPQKLINGYNAYKEAGKALHREIERLGGDKVLLLSMAETATQMGPRLAEFIDRDIMLLNSTRSPVQGKNPECDRSDYPILCEFKEEHSHAVAHYIQYQGDLDIDTLILIDDEYSTGKTLLNAVEALWRAGIQPKNIITFAFLDWRKEVGLIAKKYGVTETPICLYSGEFEFTSNGRHQIGDEVRQTELSFTSIKTGRVTQLLKLGVYKSQLGDEVNEITMKIPLRFPELEKMDQTVLVLADGENHYEAWEFAKHLEKMYPNNNYRMGSMTRSPILAKNVANYPIKRKDVVKCNGETRYFYNVTSEYDRVVLYFSPEHIEWIR